MRRLILLAAVAALFMVALPVASAGAAPAEQVHFEVTSFFAGTYGAPTGYGTFNASGPAELSGTVCDHGWTVDLSYKELPYKGPSQGATRLQVLKQFGCEGQLENTFFVDLRVRIDPEKGTAFNWAIKGGTGTYEGLKGAGTGFVDHDLFDPNPPGDQIGVYDIYDGKLH